MIAVNMLELMALTRELVVSDEIDPSGLHSTLKCVALTALERPP
jgi:hypothetical protein